MVHKDRGESLPNILIKCFWYRWRYPFFGMCTQIAALPCSSEYTLQDSRDYWPGANLPCSILLSDPQLRQLWPSDGEFAGAVRVFCRCLFFRFLDICRYQIWYINVLYQVHNLFAGRRVRKIKGNAISNQGMVLAPWHLPRYFSFEL